LTHWTFPLQVRSFAIPPIQDDLSMIMDRTPNWAKVVAAEIPAVPPPTIRTLLIVSTHLSNDAVTIDMDLNCLP
jgi:hypothetical protein